MSDEQNARLLKEIARLQGEEKKITEWWAQEFDKLLACAPRFEAMWTKLSAEDALPFGPEDTLTPHIIKIETLLTAAEAKLERLDAAGKALAQAILESDVPPASVKVAAAQLLLCIEMARPKKTEEE